MKIKGLCIEVTGCHRRQKIFTSGEFMFLCSRKEVGEGMLSNGNYTFYIDMEG